MNEDKKTIDLVFRRKDFEEIYFRNNQGNIYFGPNIKVPFLLLCIVVVTFLFALYHSISEDRYIVFTVISFFCLLLVGYSYSRQANQVWKWKKSINSYLNDLSLFKSHKIILTDTSFCLNQDAEETIEKWSEIKKAILKEDYIYLYGSQSYFFPRKSMTEEDYKRLWDIVKDKIRNGL